MLNEKENKKFDIITKFISKEITVKEVMNELDLTERQIYRLKKVFVEQGKEGFSHKNKGKIPTNKKDENLIKELEDLYLEKHYYFNLRHFF